MKKKRATQSLFNNKKDWHELNERNKTHFQCFVFTVNENGEDKKIWENEEKPGPCFAQAALSLLTESHYSNN